MIQKLIEWGVSVDKIMKVLAVATLVLVLMMTGLIAYSAYAFYQGVTDENGTYQREGLKGVITKVWCGQSCLEKSAKK